MEQGAFFFLLQSEDGDLFKCWIEHEGEEVKSLKIKYFDTVPVAASLCILKSGYLFVASEFSDQWAAAPTSRGSSWQAETYTSSKH
jgi:splicing factor 3B subunit 3